MEMDDDVFGELLYENEDEVEHDQQRNLAVETNDILPELSEDEEDVIALDDDIDGKENNEQPHQNVGQQMQMARKRGPIGGVFNDFSPIDWHLHIGDDEVQAKRRRVELEEAVQRETVRILTARRHQRRPPAASDESAKTMVPLQMTRRNKLLRVPPMDGQIWWGINSVDGTFRRYLTTRRRAKDSALSLGAHFSDDDLSLAKLLQAEERVHDREQQQQQLQVEQHSVHSAATCGQQMAVINDAMTSSLQNARNDNPRFGLWADKYAPRTFLDLLTEDETNRIVLLWLRLWDECVFEKDRGGKKGQCHGHTNLHRNVAANASSSLWDSLEERDRTLLEMERPKGGGTYGRMPKQKILALFGPSGVGKSSLARVAAVQAGYRPVVIPISELQNVAELKSRLENATDCTSIDALFGNLSVSHAPSSPSSGSTVDNCTRPCCFIVEEVEQASSDMIQFLCSWVRRSRVSSSSAASVVRRRPVICTCASLWNSPSLRDLRANSLPVRVQSCNRDRMRRRLEQICRCEAAQVGRVQLDELLLSHGSDVRLCLNTLQFCTLKTSAASSKIRNSGAAVDQKGPDGVGLPPSPINTAVTASLFDTLAAIFTLDFHQDNRGIVRPLPVRSRTLQSLFGQMPFEDFGRVQQLVFNNFATVLKLNMAQCRLVATLFTQLDTHQTLLQRHQHFVLARYLPFALAFVHFHCALHVSRRLMFNLTALPFAEQQRDNQQIVRSLRANVVTGGNRYIGLTDVCRWFAPLLWLVLQPPVQQSLWSDGGGGGQEQRQLLHRVVELMRTFRISLVRTTGADGMARFTFEPAFDSLVRLPVPSPLSLSANNTTNTGSSGSVITLSTAQLISEPVKQYIAQLLENAVQQAKAGGTHKIAQQQNVDEESESSEGNVSRSKAQCTPSATDQFGPHNCLVPGQQLPPTSSSPTASSSPLLPLFTYRHSVGSSHAVRRDIRIGTLFSAFHQGI